MRSWLLRQPLGRKLLLMNAGVAALALVVALVALVILDAYRFRTLAQDDAVSIGKLVAEGMSANLAFDRPEEAQAQLEPLRSRSTVILACVYDKSGQLFSQGYHREPTGRCPPTLPGQQRFLALAARVEIPAAVAGGASSGPSPGVVYIERDWTALIDRMKRAGIASIVVLTLTVGLSVVLARRLQRAILTPVTNLAAVAQTIGKGGQYDMPQVASEEDEIGSLVKAFGAMVDRVRDANSDLSQTNQALRHEIAERKRMEAEREVLLARERDANRLKDEFLAVVSHELRTPLNAILGWSRILSLATPDAATLARATSSLSRNAKAQARVIDDLIDISRIVTGKLRVRFETVDLRVAIEGAVESIRPSADHKGVSLVVEVPREPAPLQADRDRLQQIVWNLLSNAVKFSAAGGTVRVALSATPDEYAVKVADDGVGIAPEFLPHVFDRFRQADASMTREQGGLGIGLAIVKELTELHSGTVTATSDGRALGSHFIVRFPRAVQQPVDGGQVDAAGPPPSLSGVRVLAVDDNFDALEVLEAVLVEAGAAVRTARSGAEALVAWEREVPDLLLCDLAMPDMSGYDVLAAIRQRDAAVGRFIPAIAVTAQATDDHVMRSIRSGFQHHVAKPFDATEVVRVVAQTVQRT